MLPPRTSRRRRPLERGLLVLTLAAVLAPATARADEIVADLPRDTPISAYGGLVAWSGYEEATARYRLVIRRGDTNKVVPIAGSPRAFDVSLGPDRRGRVVALYTRCRTPASGRMRETGCDIYRYDVRSQRELKLRSVSSPAFDEAHPAQWRDRLTFVRRARTYVKDGYDHTPDPHAKSKLRVLLDCDIPYVKTLSSRRTSRRLDRGQCGVTTAMTIRDARIVQVSDEDQGGAGSEAQVRLLRSGGGRARLLAREGGGEGGYSPYASPSQSASAVFLTRTGNREPMNFVRIDLRSGRRSEVDPRLPLGGSVVRDERGTFWYVQAPEPQDNFGNSPPPFCTRSFPTRSSPLLQPCRLVRASADPFSRARRVLPPRLTRSGPLDLLIVGRFGDPLAVSGELSRAVVAREAVVGREPLAGVTLDLLRNSDIGGDGTTWQATGATTSTDAAGRWSFAFPAPPSQAYYLVIARSLGVATSKFGLHVSAKVTLTVAGGSFAGAVTPAQPGRNVEIQRLDMDGEGMLNGNPRCSPPDAGQRFCNPAAWITTATVALTGSATTFSATVPGPGTYRAILQGGIRPDGSPTRPDVYGGESLQLRVGPNPPADPRAHSTPAFRGAAVRTPR